MRLIRKVERLYRTKRRRRRRSANRADKTAWRNVREAGVWWIVGALSVLAIGIGGSWIFWDELRGEADSLSTTIRNVGLVIGGAVAILFAIWRSTVAERQSQTTLAAMLHERYHRAAQALGSKDLSIRLAQIYVLERLAQDHPNEYHVQVLELLCAFVRNPTFVEKDTTLGAAIADASMPHYSRSSVREDLQAAIDAIGIGIGRRHDLESRRRFKFNLRGADLGGANLVGMDFSPPKWRQPEIITSMAEFWQSPSTDLSGAKLCGADMEFSSFPRANFHNACVCHSILPYDLSEAILSGTNWEGALSATTDLTGASLNDSDGNHPARGVIQESLDECEADPNNPPNLEGVVDAESGIPLQWKGPPRPEWH